MSAALTEIFVAVNHNDIRKTSMLVSIDGENSRAKWIARVLIDSFHLTGKTIKGTDRHGNKVILPLAHMTVPNWWAKHAGMI